MTPQDYIKQQQLDYKLTPAHIEALVRYFQVQSTGKDFLVVDGRPGPQTLARLERTYPQLFPKKTGLEADPFLSLPLPVKAGRKPVITSGFRKPGRKSHDGVDFFYPFRSGDQPAFVGDGGCEGAHPDGTPKWVVPYGTEALAAADGVVMMSGLSPTGYRLWIDHGNGLRSGYFHLEKVYYQNGVSVQKGMPIGLVGHNPVDQDGRHLHFEVSPVGKYAPVDPEKYMVQQ